MYNTRTLGQWAKYLSIFLGSIAILSYFVLRNPERWVIDPTAYYFFSVGFFGLLCLSFIKPISEFIVLFNTFLFLGFWLKSTIHIALGTFFLESAGIYTEQHINQALYYSAFGAFVLFFMQLMLKRFPLKKIITVPQVGMANRWLMLLLVCTLILTYLNFSKGFLRVGLPQEVEVIFPFSIILAWLMGPGTAFLIFSFCGEKWTFLKTLVTAVGMFLISVSTLSRNALMYFAYPFFKKFITEKNNYFQAVLHPFILFAFFIFTLLIISPLREVIYSRYNISVPSQGSVTPEDAPSLFANKKMIDNTTKHHISTLFIDRWTGIEGMIVAAVNRNDIVFKTLVSEDPRISPQTIYHKLSKSIYPVPGKSLFYTYPGPLGLIFMSQSIGLIFLSFLVFGLIMFISYWMIEHSLEGLPKSLAAWWAASNLTQLSIFPVFNLKVYFCYLLMIVGMAYVFKLFFEKKLEKESYTFRGLINLLKISIKTTMKKK